MGNGVASLKDVAKLANVSVPTVSRILRRQMLTQFSKETRERVLDAASRLRYRPNMLVKGIQSGLTRTIGVMVPPFSSYWAEVLYGIHDQLIAADHVPIVLWTKHRPEVDHRHASADLEQIHRLIDRRVDGFVLWPPVTPAFYNHLEEMSSRNLPVVTIDHELPSEYGADSVATDEESGAKIVVSHLLNLGHRHFAHLSGLGNDNYSWAKLRRQYFENEVAGIPGATCITLGQSEWNPTEGVNLARKLLRTNPRPTAILAASDERAPYIYTAAAEMNLRIPQDLSVVGFGDLDIAPRFQPPLTTVRQKPYEMGCAAARLILDRVQGIYRDHQNQRIRIGCELVIRNSTAAPRE